MSFLAKLFGYLRLPKITIVSKILLASFVVLFIFGFTEYDPDNLYSYQWGLKNNGNFMVGNAFLRNNHKASYFDKTTNDTRFFDRRDIVDYLISHGLAQDSMKAMENFDIKWDMGYEFFKSIVGGRKSIIALIDTGVDITHFELIDSIWINENEIRDNGVDDDRNGYIDDVCGYNFNGKNNNVMPENQSEVHGTHAAGIMVAKHNNMGTKGIAYDENIKLMPLKVLDSNENGYMSSVIAAINYAKSKGAKICNISLGAYTYDYNIDQVIKNNSDMLFIVSAGNGMDFVGYSLDERDVYPAKLDYDNVITVSNASFNGERFISANFGSYVDIFAPGTFILSTAPKNDFAYMTGTSMAAPFVSAVCAMIYSKFPNVPISDYKKLIIESASEVYALSNFSKSRGLLNVYSALVNASKY